MTRDEAVKWLQGIEERYFHGGDEAYDKRRREAVRMAIESLERKHGGWIDNCCSVCGYEPYNPSGMEKFYYCSNCGADMQERREE